MKSGLALGPAETVPQRRCKPSTQRVSCSSEVAAKSSVAVTRTTALELPA
eukprot:CAMPEP_0185838266 /NCGR_PEP_ID=MMETSP1353-20130828/12783_1 /TAXON_ID=1077150 /ORGANISM="Erythrolobus australicus, Strain CCMP3124" /LENGTH=49 /DNA_ID= /DNA_START= /DNA_END= /DNA_ORIENTATION=